MVALWVIQIAITSPLFQYPIHTNVSRQHEKDFVAVGWLWRQLSRFSAACNFTCSNTEARKRIRCSKSGMNRVNRVPLMRVGSGGHTFGYKWVLLYRNGTSSSQRVRLLTRSNNGSAFIRRTRRLHSLLEMIRGPTLSPVSLLCFTWEPSHIGNCKQHLGSWVSNAMI